MKGATLQNPVRIAKSILDEFSQKRGDSLLKEIVKKYGIKLEPWCCMNEISGALIVTKKYVAIGYNSNHPKTRQRFTIAHEIGHYLLGHESGICNTLQNEQVFQDNIWQSKNKDYLADIFAAELLMPVDKINEFIDYGISKKIMAKAFGVSMDAITLRLKHLKLIA